MGESTNILLRKAAEQGDGGCGRRKEGKFPVMGCRAGKAVRCESRRGLDRMSRERVRTKLPPTEKVREHENVVLIRWGLGLHMEIRAISVKLEEQNKQILKSDCYKPLCLTCVNGDHGFTASSSSNPVTSVSVKLYTQPSIHPEILQVIAAPLNSLLITYSSLVISAVTIGIKLLWSFTVQQCSGRRLMVRS